MIVVRPGDVPCEKSVMLALMAQAAVRRTAELMEAMECSRVSALNLILQAALVDLGAMDSPGMERLARAVSANVAAALRGDQSGKTLDEVTAACAVIEAAYAANKGSAA